MKSCDCPILLRVTDVVVERLYVDMLPDSTVLSGDHLLQITGRMASDRALFRSLEGTDFDVCQRGIRSGPSLAVPIGSGPLA
jgi:hypothetical protein